MSSNFYDTSGFCGGADPHTYYGLGPLGAPLPVPLSPYIVFCFHKWITRDWRIAKTVTTRGHQVFQSNWAMLLLPHIPTFPTTPHAIEAVQAASLVLAGNATPQLTVHKVTAQGGPLCVEVSGSQGMNLDCGDLPCFSQDFNANTVMTQPTRGDYVAAVLSAALSFAYAWGVNRAIGKLFPVPDTAKEIIKKGVETVVRNIAAQASTGNAVATIQTLLDLWNSKSPDGSWNGEPAPIAISKVTQTVQQLIDGE